LKNNYGFEFKVVPYERWVDRYAKILRERFGDEYFSSESGLAIINSNEDENLTMTGFMSCMSKLGKENLIRTRQMKDNRRKHEYMVKELERDT
jgi:hypothetical protein